MPNGKPQYRILSFDGGGIRGLLSLILLERLEKEVPGWLDKAELLAGTSTGGIIALGLAHGVTAAGMRRLYEERGKLVFDDSWWDDLCDLGKTRGADYKTKNLETEVRRLLGNTKLKDLKKRVLIPAFDPTSRSATQGKHGQPAFAGLRRARENPVTHGRAPTCPA